MLRPRRRDPARRLAAGLAIVLVAGACVRQDAPGVTVESFNADLVFGVKEVAAATPPANMPAPAAAPGAPEPMRQMPQFDDKSFLTRIPQTTRPQAACPPARREAFPAEEATLRVERLPTEGMARWKQYGVQEYASLDTEFPVEGFERRTVQDVRLVRGTEEEPLEFEYQTAQEDFFSGTIVVSTFRVTNDAVQRQLDSRTEIATGRVVRGGEPDRGLALVSIEYVDPKSGDVLNGATFSPPVLYLPLEVVPGEPYEAIGVDPRTGSTLRHEAKVIGRSRVDACGDVVDGWLVESTQVFAGNGGTFERTYNYIVATQLGGVIIREHVEAYSRIGLAKVTFDLGQLKPSPLPDGEVR